jgi:glycosyltransferase involved in cell wall biosynthesis
VLRVLFYGSYLPLHGVETIVEAASILRGAAVSFTLVGGGQTFEAVRARAAGLGAEKVVFLPPVDAERLAGLIAEADIVLGVFGTTPKARLVVPNKVFQALAVGRAVVTADTPAVRELFQPGVHLVTVPAGEPGALARAIESLGADRAASRRLGETGGAYTRERFSSTKIAERLLGILGEAGFA